LIPKLVASVERHGDVLWQQADDEQDGEADVVVEL